MVYPHCVMEAVMIAAIIRVLVIVLIMVLVIFQAILALDLLFRNAVVKTDYSEAVKKNATVYYYLPESLIKISATAKVAVIYNTNCTISDSSKIIEQDFVTTTEMIADTKNLLSLNYKPHALMSDDIKYGVNSRGLLETVNVTTEDRTPDIIAKLSQASQAIIGAASVRSSTYMRVGVKPVVKIKEFTSDFAIKASEISNMAKTITWNLTILNELNVNEEPKVVAAEFTVSSTDLVAKLPALSTLINGCSSKKPEIDGILTRPLKNISLKIGSSSKKLSNSLPTNIVIADATKLIVIPVNRTPFVKRTNKIGIQNGVILSNEINNPSSVEGLASIPINIAKAIVSIPGQLIQFKFDNTKRLDELKKTELNYEKANSLNSIELKKLKLDLQTSLLEAERKELEARKALDEIKKSLKN